jgi:hypothetical protein
MSDGCEGCYISNKGQNELLEATRTKAKQYAVEQKKTVAIYREGYEFRYCDAEISTGLAIIELVSQHQSVTT